MQKVSVDPEGLAAYAATAEGLGADTAAAAARAAAADPLLLGPIFGLVGNDFVTAYAAAHAGHFAGIGELSAVLGSMGAASTGAAAAYTATDLERAAALQATEGGLRA